MDIIIALLVFGVIVLIHEFGHYIVAKKSGILVEEFAVGMGPKLISKKYGETVYSIRALPLGGFCKMLGEDASSEDKRSFNNKSVAVRIAVIAAGPFMNILLALIITMWYVSTTGFLTTTINKTIPNFPAEKAGFQPGDKIISVDGQRIHIKDEIDIILYETKGAPIKVTILRNKKQITKVIEPMKDAESDRWLIGFEPQVGENNFIPIIIQSFWYVIFIVKQVIIGFFKIITFQVAKEQIAGPVGVIDIIGTAYETGLKSSIFTAIQYVLRIAALISANLGVMNLLPIPALDGGRLVFLFVEALRGKPVDPEKEGLIHFAGFVLLMVLMVFILYNDIVRIIVH